MKKEITPSGLWEWLSKVNTVKFLLLTFLGWILAGAIALSIVVWTVRH